VPAGGLRADGLRWMRPKSPDFFLPQIVLAARFRTRLKDALLKCKADFATIPASIWKLPWVVDVQPAGRGEGALKYLSAYVTRTALGNRILSDHAGKITFQYKDSGDGSQRVLTLSAMEFLRRFLQHVLPKGFPRVRHYGWLSPAAKPRWQRILALLDYAPPRLILTPRPEALCRHCGGNLCWIGTLGRGPPMTFRK
jgi:hypothetical protein